MPIAIIAVIVVALIGAGAYFLSSDEVVEVSEQPTTDVARTDTTAPADEMMDEPEASGPAGSEPDDETAAATPYSTEVSYLTPARTSHEMDITLTVADDGTVVGANIVYDNGDGFSNPHQERFDNAYQEMVVGQNIDDIDLSVVGSASLTTGAFNDAVQEIQAQRG